MTELGPIPVDWEVKRLGEIFTFKNGYNASANCYGSGIPVASVLDALSTRSITRQSIATKVNAPSKDQDSFSLKSGDLIFTRSSETLEDVGRSNVYLDADNAMFGGFVIRGRPSVVIDSLFVNYMLNTSSCRIRVMSHGAGAQHFNIGQSGLEKVLIPLPPLAEQRRIAGALSDVDELISALGKLIEKKHNIKTGAMQELLGMRNEEGGMRNVPRRRLVGFSGEWVEKRLGECGKIVREIENPFEFPNKQFVEYSMPAFDAGKKAQVVLGKNMLSSRTRIQGEVLLFNKLNVRQRRIWYVNACPNNAICSSEFLPYYSDLINLLFLAYILDTEQCARYFIDVSKGTSNSQKRIAPKDFEDYMVLLPPTLAEQQAIAAVLSDIDAEIAALEADRAKYERIKSGMMQELLTGKTRLKGM